jgi:hypothetical protein
VAITQKLYRMRRSTALTFPVISRWKAHRPRRFDGAHRWKRPGETTWARRLCCAVACARVFTRRSHQSPASRRGGTSEHAARRKRGSRAVTGMERVSQQCVRHAYAGPQCATLARAAAPAMVQALLGGDKKPVVLRGFACKTTAEMAGVGRAKRRGGRLLFVRAPARGARPFCAARSACARQKSDARTGLAPIVSLWRGGRI